MQFLFGHLSTVKNVMVEQKHLSIYYKANKKRVQPRFLGEKSR